MLHHGHDHGYKLLFSHPEMIADLIRGYVREPWVERVDLSTLEKVGGSYVSDDLREREDDMIWRLRWKGNDRWVYVYLLLEFQSTSERFMPLRVLTYLGLLYEDLRRRDELTDNKLLPPVLPIVLYRGAEQWRGAEDVADLIERVPGGLEGYCPTLRYLMLDERRHGDKYSQNTQNLVSALFALESSRSPADLEVVLKNLVTWLQRPEQVSLRRSFTVWLKRVLLPTRVRGVNFESLNDLQEVRGMLSERVDDWTQNWKEQGIEEGRKIGLELGRREGRQEGEVLLLMRQIEQKFGAEALDACRKRIEAADAEALLDWSVRILTAKSVDEAIGSDITR